MTTLQDLRYALRMLGKNPGFTALAVVTLGLGLGANLAIFSAVDAVLFRPLPVHEPERLVRIYATDEKGTDFFQHSYPSFADYRDAASVFSGLAAFSDSDPVHLSTGGKPERLTGAVVSGSYFPILGVRAQRGRLLTPEDDRNPGAHPYLVVSDRIWRSRFGADPAAVGASVLVNGHPFTILGVAPAHFVGVNLDSLPDVWIPMAMVDQALPDLAESHVLTSRHVGFLEIVGRLKPGATIAGAQAELDVIARHRAAAEPDDRQEPMARVVSAAGFAIGPDSRSQAHRISWLLLGVAALVLLIACADAAGLLLVRAERRRREIGVRRALGASRGRIARQLFVESALLAGLGTVAGVLFAAWSVPLLAAAMPEDFPVPLSTAALDGRALAFGAAAAFLSAIFFGMMPALQAARVDLVASLKDASRARTARRLFTLKDTLVGGQMAVTAVLLVGAGLTARTLAREAAVDPGFITTGRLEASVDLSRQGYDHARGSAFYAELLRRAAAMPGVRSAALARSVPVQRSGMRTTIESDGYTPRQGETPDADLNIVTPGYFGTIGSRIVAGRDFDARDTEKSPAVAIVSESMARKFWPGRNAVGRRIRNLGPPGVGGEVVGVARDLRSRSLRQPAESTVYVPASQFYMPRMTLVLEGNGDPAALARPLGALVAGLDSGLPLFHVRTLEDKLGVALGQERLLAMLVGTFAGLALLLAAAGLYGVVSYATQMRAREFGIRLALGAPSGHVRGLVLGHTARLAALGLGTGLALAALTSRLVEALLFGVSPLDPVSYLAAAALLTATVLAASALPASRAARTDPMTSLRSE